MVARNIADVSLLFAVVVRRKTFFQENPSIMLNKIQVEPHLVMAALIGLPDAWSFMRNGECSVLACFPLSSESGGLRN